MWACFFFNNYTNSLIIFVPFFNTTFHLIPRNNLAE